MATVGLRGRRSVHTGMAEPFSTSDLIMEVRRYEQEHRELLESHHFVFDCPLDRTNVAKPDIIWFGVNPGQDEEDWRRRPARSEETRDHDFQAECGRSKASAERMEKLRQFLGAGVFRRTTHCELFFWCSKDTGPAFRERYGFSFEANPHWNFCCDINRRLVARVKPIAVLAESRRRLPLYERRLSLRPSHVHRNDRGDVLVNEQRLDGDIPFYCFDHLSYLFSYRCPKERRLAVKEKVAALLEAEGKRRRQK